MADTIVHQHLWFQVQVLVGPPNLHLSRVLVSRAMPLRTFKRANLSHPRMGRSARGAHGLIRPPTCAVCLQAECKYFGGHKDHLSAGNSGLMYVVIHHAGRTSFRCFDRCLSGRQPAAARRYLWAAGAHLIGRWRVPGQLCAKDRRLRHAERTRRFHALSARLMTSTPDANSMTPAPGSQRESFPIILKLSSPVSAHRLLSIDENSVEKS